MKKVYRVLVYLVALAIPVVIAACYGPAYRYRPGGKVDRDERAQAHDADEGGVVPDGGVAEPAAH